MDRVSSTRKGKSKFARLVPQKPGFLNFDIYPGDYFVVLAGISLWVNILCHIGRKDQ